MKQIKVLVADGQMLSQNAYIVKGNIELPKDGLVACTLPIGRDATPVTFQGFSIVAGSDNTFLLTRVVAGEFKPWMIEVFDTSCNIYVIKAQSEGDDAVDAVVIAASPDNAKLLLDQWFTANYGQKMSVYYEDLEIHIESKLTLPDDAAAPVVVYTNVIE